MSPLLALAQATTTDLPGVFGSVAPFLQDYGYLAVALVLFVDNVGVPLPSEAVLATGSVFAATGRLNIVAVATVAFVASVLGGNGGYAVGRFGGRPLVERWGRRLGVTSRRLDRVEAFFARHGTKVVLVARFVPLLRQFYGLVAGTSQMPWWRFLAANIAGAAVWVAFWTTLGFHAGDHLDQVASALSSGGPILLLLVLAVLLGVAGRRRRRRRAAVPAATTPDPDPARVGSPS